MVNTVFHDKGGQIVFHGLPERSYAVLLPPLRYHLLHTDERQITRNCNMSMILAALESYAYSVVRLFKWRVLTFVSL